MGICASSPSGGGGAGEAEASPSASPRRAKASSCGSLSRSLSRSRSSSLELDRLAPSFVDMPAEGVTPAGRAWKTVARAVALNELAFRPALPEGFEDLPAERRREMLADLAGTLLREAVARGDPVVRKRMELRGMEQENEAELVKARGVTRDAEAAYAASESGAAHTAAFKALQAARGKVIGVRREMARAAAASEKEERRDQVLRDAETDLKAADEAEQEAAAACPELAALRAARESLRALEERLGIEAARLELVRLQSRHGAKSGRRGRGYEDECVAVIEALHREPAERGEGPFGDAFAAVRARYPHAALTLVPNVTVSGYSGELDALLCAVVDETALSERGKNGKTWGVLAVLCAYEFKANAEDVAHGFRTKERFLRFLAGHECADASEKVWPDRRFTGHLFKRRGPPKSAYRLSPESFAPVRRTVDEDGTCAASLVFVTRPRDAITNVSSSAAGMLVSAASAPSPPLDLRDPHEPRTAARLDRLAERVRRHEAAGNLGTCAVLRDAYIAAGLGSHVLLVAWEEGADGGEQ